MIVDGRTLVVVADGRHARLFEESRRDGPLHEHADWLGELPHLHEGGKGEPPGRVFDRMGHASHGTHGEAPHDKGERLYLEGLAHQLDAVVRNHKFDDVILIAPPKALGVLRAALPKSVEQKVKGTDAHDRANATAGDIQKALHAIRLAKA